MLDTRQYDLWWYIDIELEWLRLKMLSMHVLMLLDRLSQLPIKARDGEYVVTMSAQ
jgi:hypothetical protein